jgi:hypothetical protein
MSEFDNNTPQGADANQFGQGSGDELADVPEAPEVPEAAQAYEPPQYSAPASATPPQGDFQVPPPPQDVYKAPPQSDGYQAPPTGGYQAPPQGGYQSPQQNYGQYDRRYYANQPYNPSIVLGIIGIVAGLFIGPAGIILGVIGTVQAQRNQADYDISKGRLLSIIAIITSAVSWMIGQMMIRSM